MNLDRLDNGERISSISAILLFIFMFFHWFSVEAFSNPNSLLIDFRGSRPARSAWEALDYIPIVLLITILATLAVAGLHLMSTAYRRRIPVNVVVALLGSVSALLILFRILDPPSFGAERFITFEGMVQVPIFLALLAAGGIAFGGCLAAWEEGFSLSDLRTRRDKDPASEQNPFGHVR